MKAVPHFLMPLLLLGTTFTAIAQTVPSNKLKILYVDVEGGAATLIVTPTRESILVDAGWAGFEGRDATRIQRAMQQAGITAIDHLITTHFHQDHFGGLPQLAAAVRISRFYDHGRMTTLAEDKDFAPKYAAYRQAARNKTITLMPGEQIKLRKPTGAIPLTLQIITSNGRTINELNESGKTNPECQGATLKPDDPSDNARSVGFVLRYGDFDFYNAGDLTWNIEHHLFCPGNPVGEVDLYQVTHHGLSISNNPVVLRSLRPTVAIMNNGARKGGDRDTVKWLRETSSLKTLFQMHLNSGTKPEENTASEFIANLTEKPDDAHMIIVEVDAVAKSFTVTNGRTGNTQTYQFK